MGLSKLRAALGAILLLVAGTAGAASEAADTGPAEALKARYAAIGERLDKSPLAKPLVLDSTESNGELKGDVHARIDHRFDALGGALRQAARWCDILILPLNTKGCTASGDAITMHIGRKYDQPLELAQRMVFKYAVEAASPGYLRIVLSSEGGPLGTRDYRIMLEAIPIEGGRAFMHLAYSYHYGSTARVAMGLYLKAEGDKRVGFTADGQDGSGKPTFVRGMRGVMERNTMRYYLAIDAFLRSLSAPPAQQLEKRLEAWFAATERYPRQLHEIDRTAYLEMKRKEVQRAQAG